jgi:signal transduction histidine kinase
MLVYLTAIAIHIADHGSGISSTTQQRLFDPFFTTKPVGKGTGMGLSISYQIVTERHQGSLTCISAPKAQSLWSKFPNGNRRLWRCRGLAGVPAG